MAGATPQSVSQWGDEASYGNLNPCQPTRRANLGGSGSNTSLIAGLTGGWACRESDLADKKAIFRLLVAIPKVYAIRRTMVRACGTHLRGFWIWPGIDNDSPSIHDDRRCPPVNRHLLCFRGPPRRRAPPRPRGLEAATPPRKASPPWCRRRRPEGRSPWIAGTARRAGGCETARPFDVVRPHRVPPASAPTGIAAHDGSAREVHARHPAQARGCGRFPGANVASRRSEPER